MGPHEALSSHLECPGYQINCQQMNHFSKCLPPFIKCLGSRVLYYHPTWALIFYYNDLFEISRAFSPLLESFSSLVLCADQRMRLPPSVCLFSYSWQMKLVSTAALKYESFDWRQSMLAQCGVKSCPVWPSGQHRCWPSRYHFDLVHREGRLELDLDLSEKKLRIASPFSYLVWKRGGELAYSFQMFTNLP